MLSEPDFAEVCGIHAGDGYLRNDGKRREIDVSGSFEEKEFYDQKVIPLFSKVFNLQLTGRYFPARGTYGFVIRDRNAVEMLHNAGFPYGKKTTSVEIPGFILDSKNPEVNKRFLRGLFDTDGSFTVNRNGSVYNYYPRIIIATCSKKLSIQTGNLLRKNKVGFCVQTYVPKVANENTRYKIWVNGKNAEKWMALIGSQNPIQLTRYEIWRKYGFCPPRTTFEQRKQILNKQTLPSLI